jgi:hypothetical protein
MFHSYLTHTVSDYSSRRNNRFLATIKTIYKNEEALKSHETLDKEESVKTRLHVQTEQIINFRVPFIQTFYNLHAINSKTFKNCK